MGGPDDLRAAGKRDWAVWYAPKARSRSRLLCPHWRSPPSFAGSWPST